VELEPLSGLSALDEVPLKPGKKKRRRAAGLFDEEDESPLSGQDEALLEELRAKRLEIAKERGIPAFQIFSNRTLEALARLRPTSEDEALQVPGIGPAKAAKEFPAFSEIIARFG
jgi:ATP-dependent DNA helicase RecQ